ncbi:hypothetical protein ACHAXA_007977, partial [Cyclostephanos tholiformis]
MNPNEYTSHHPSGGSNPEAAAPAPHQPYKVASSSFLPRYAVMGPGGVITSATARDVLNGRGQGVQRHPGNTKYRTLVFVNKGLYAKCTRNDKLKISKGIVAAVRKVGGRFLELDERSGIYIDIGDKKATEKTSQALREGQTKIRLKLYNDEHEMALDPARPIADEKSLPTPLPREISAEAYFGYSVQVLESLYIADENASDASMSSDNKMVVAAAAAAAATANNIGTDVVRPTPPCTASESAVLNQIAMMKALEQFPGPRPTHQGQQHSQKQHHQQMPTSLPISDVSMSPDNKMVVSAAANASNIGSDIVRPTPSSTTSQSAIINHVAMMKALEQFPGLRPTHQSQQHSQKQHYQQMPNSLPASSSTYVNSAAVARALEQFPGVPPTAQQAVPIQQKQHQNQKKQHQQKPCPLAIPPTLPSSSTYGYSVGVDRNSEQCPGAALLAQQVPPAQLQKNQQQLSPPQPRFAKRGFEPGAMAMIFDQYTGTARGHSQPDPSLHAPIGRYSNMSSMGISEAGIGGGGWGYRPSFGDGRPTNMSLASMFSINSLRQLVESACRDRNRQANRGTMESMLSAEIRDLIQLSAPQLEQVDNFAMEDTESHVGREVDSFYNQMEDRVSELRFTDVSRWSSMGEAEHKPRLTDSTELSHVSRSSSMEASVRSSATDNMTIHSSPDGKR